MDIKKLVRTCGFEDQQDRMTRDRIVLGTNDKQLQKRLLEADSLDVGKAIEMARSAEATKKQAQEMQKPTTSTVRQTTSLDAVTQRDINLDKYKNYSNSRNTNFDAYNSNSEFKKKHETNRNHNKNFVKNKFSNNKNNFVGFNGNCKYCKSKHEYRKCPAYGKICNNCEKPNHFAVACTVRKVRELNIKNDDDIFYMDSIVSKKYFKNEHKRDSWSENIRIQNNIFKFKLDTGAEVNVLPLEYFKKLKSVNIGKNEKIIEAYGGTKINTVGSVDLTCRCRNEISKQKFIIVDSDNTIPILGL